MTIQHILLLYFFFALKISLIQQVIQLSVFPCLGKERREKKCKLTKSVNVNYMNHKVNVVLTTTYEY